MRQLLLALHQEDLSSVSTEHARERANQMMKGSFGIEVEEVSFRNGKSLFKFYAINPHFLFPALG